MRALVVDDDESVRELIHAILRQRGHSGESAVDGEEALRMLASERWDVLVLDLMLPKINGIAILDSLRDMPDPPALIVFSAVSRYFTERFPSEATVLQKPFEIEKLGEALDRITRAVR